MPEKVELLHIICKDPPMDFKVPMGDGVATLTGAGLGGWTTTAVIEGEALSTWEGQTQLAQDVPVMLDGWGMHPRSVQPELDKLLKLALARPNASRPAPPVFRVKGPVHFPGRYWVLPEGGIELSTDEEDVFRDGDGTLLRQALTLHLLAFNYDTPAHARAKRKKRESFKDLGEAVPVAYTTHDGETFIGIATRELGDWSLWQQIAEKNPKLPQGPYITLPAGVTVTL